MAVKQPKCKPDNYLDIAYKICYNYFMKGVKILKKEFINTTIFDKRWAELKLTDNDLRSLQNILMQNSSVGDMIEGTGGAYKIRFSIENKGKSGGIRVIYINLLKAQRIYFITCYPKSKQDNLLSNEKAIIKEVVKRIISNEREGLQ